MDIWRESGNRLAVLMPAPQKCSYTLTSAHTPTQTHISTPSYQLSRALSHPYFLLSDYLRTCSVRASWEFWNLLDFPSSLSAKGRRPGRRLDRSRKCPPTEREDGTADKGDSGFVQRTVHHGLPPSLTSLCLYVLPRVGACQLISHVLSGARADSWPGNPFQESQVDFCVKQRSIIGRPD